MTSIGRSCTRCEDMRYRQSTFLFFLWHILPASASADGQLRTVVCEHVSQPDRTDPFSAASLFLVRSRSPSVVPDSTRHLLPTSRRFSAKSSKFHTPNCLSSVLHVIVSSSCETCSVEPRDVRSRVRRVGEVRISWK